MRGRFVALFIMVGVVVCAGAFVMNYWSKGTPQFSKEKIDRKLEAFYKIKGRFPERLDDPEFRPYLADGMSVKIIRCSETNKYIVGFSGKFDLNKVAFSYEYLRSNIAPRVKLLHYLGGCDDGDH